MKSVNLNNYYKQILNNSAEIIIFLMIKISIMLYLLGKYLVIKKYWVIRNKYELKMIDI